MKKHLALLVVALIGLNGCTKSKTESANTLHLVEKAKIKGLDPALTDDLYAGYEVGRVYESLYQYHYLKRPFTLIPNLAEAMPEMSADGKTLTIKLKKGVLFQDDAAFKENGGKGREMTADDVVYSFKRVADPKNVSPQWSFFEGKIVGLNEWHEQSAKAGTTDYSKVIEGLKATDRYTLQIKLTQRSYQFIYFLAMPFTGVVAHEAVEFYGKEFLNHPVGTGPFRLKEFVPGSKLIYVKNPTYRKEVYPSEGEPGDKEAGLLEDAGKPIPFADQVDVQILEEDQPRWLNFMAGKLDTVEIPKDSFDNAIGPDKELKADLKQKGMRLLKQPELDITHVSFNMEDPLVGKNKLLRQALSLAYDQPPFIQLFYNGRAIPAQGPIPPGIAGYDANYKNPYRQFDLAKAKDLLAKAGYPEGKGLPPLEVVAMSDTTNRQMSDYLEKSWKAIGVQVKTGAYTWPEFQANVKNKKGQVWEFAWGADYPDAENFLQLFYSKNGSPGPNDANYNNPEFDRMYEKSLTMPDSAERTALYKQMVAVVAEDCPWIFNAHRLRFDVANPWLKNFKYHGVDHTWWKYLKVDKK